MDTATIHIETEIRSTERSRTKLVPTLRFNEFDTCWNIRTIGSVCNMKAGNFVKASEIFEEKLEGMFPCYGGNGLRGFTKTSNQDGKFSLIGRQGAHCGNIKLANGKFYATEHAIVVSLSEEYDTDWIFYLLYNSNLNQYSTGQAQPGLSVKNLEKINVIIPPSLIEQQKIASFLSAVDKKIQQLSKKKALLEQYKKGVMQQLFSQKLRFKDEQGKDYPDWEEKRLLEFCKFFSGGTPSSTNKEYYNGKIPFIGSGNIYDSEVFSFISEVAFNSSSAKLVEKGDLLYALYGANSGESAISKLEGAINQAILCIRTKESIEYLNYILVSNKDKIVSKYLQGGQGNLSAQIIKKLKYKFPCLEEQQKIASYLSAIDSKIESVSNQISQTQSFKKGLLQQMFI
ncbi:restriction endonuclease subunit S [Ancylomarina longa]|uniref:Restriction endonuclease subunit S n=1 Tax=Ancylomarina longa TaxID=2487017 RepID=A0A434AWW2_9BACT|nr:restriction endonuclease subunit S [Ancylomarina longa]RUT79011.1 restriction endonuclease subunit S [Ancylomarina longa]